MNTRVIALASVIAGLFFTSQSLFAAILTLTPGPNSKDGVNIAATAAGNVEGRTFSLAHVSSGERVKKVGPFGVNIYVAQLLVSDTQKFCAGVTTNPLASIDLVQSVGFVSTFVHQVSQDQLMTSFKDSFVANKVDMGAPQIQAFLAVVQAGGEVLVGQSFSIVGEKLADGTEAITYEAPAGFSKTIRGPQGFVKSILSIWLGVPADKELGNLGKELSTCGVN